MKRKIAAMIDMDLDKKVREIQSERIIEETSYISYSQEINDLLRKAIKQKLL